MEKLWKNVWRANCPFPKETWFHIQFSLHCFKNSIMGPSFINKWCIFIDKSIIYIWNQFIYLLIISILRLNVDPHTCWAITPPWHWLSHISGLPGASSCSTRELAEPHLWCLTKFFTLALNSLWSPDMYITETL